MNYMALTKNYFTLFKKPYTFYGTHTEIDAYGDEHIVADTDPRETVYTMWHPLEDRIQIAEYGRDFDKVLYCIIYGDTGIQYGDRVEINGGVYEVSSVRVYNTHKRVDAKRMKVT